MHICLVTYAIQVGGVETFLRHLGRYFTSLGHSVVYLETLEKGRWSESFEGDGFQVKQILPAPLISKIAHSKKIAKYLNNFDLILLNDSPLAQASIGLLSDSTVVIPVLHMYMTSMARNAVGSLGNWDGLAAVCPAGAKSAIHFGADPRLVSCIPNGIIVSDEYPRKREDFIECGPLRIGFVGSINHSQKGVLYLIGIVKQLLADHIDITLDIVGDGPELAKLRGDFIPFRKRVTIHGATPNASAQEILSRIEVLIMPSHFEGLPLVLLEAMSHGVVPVVSRLEGCTDFVVTDSHDGFLVQVGDEAGFVSALKQLAGNRDLLRKMSAAAWGTAFTRFSYKTTGDSYLSLVKDCLDRKKKSDGPKRTGKVECALLGDFPALPLVMVRPLRKLLRLIGQYPEPKTESLLYIPEQQ